MHHYSLICVHRIRESQKMNNEIIYQTSFSWICGTWFGNPKVQRFSLI